MSQILKLTHENQQLKRQINQYQQVLGVSPFIDDSVLKGGYRVVKTITDRDKIDCCHRKQGMKVIVVGEDLSFKEYILKTDNCKENTWEEISVTVEENEVFLIEDYSELSEDLMTQKDLNLVLKQLILNLQTALNGKLDKGGYVGTAQDIYDRFEGKNTADYNNIPKVGNGASGKVLENSIVGQTNGKIGIGLAVEASEKLEVNGNVKAIDFKGQSVKFNLQASITPTPNTLVPKTDGSGLVWYDNNSVPTNLGENIKEVGLISSVNNNIRPELFRFIRNNIIQHSSVNDTSNPITLYTLGNKSTYLYTPFEFFTHYNIVITLLNDYSSFINKDGTIVNYNSGYKLWLPAGSILKIFGGTFKII